MFFTGYFLASATVRMSIHILRVPCGAEDLGFHRERRSRGARGSTAVMAELLLSERSVVVGSVGVLFMGSVALVQSSFHSEQNHLRKNKVMPC